ncbi:5397_t:CDS:1, partial [Racocetra persica]
IDFFKSNIDYMDNLVFNHPFISGIIGLDVVDEIMLMMFSSDELKEMMYCDKIVSWKMIDKQIKTWVAALVKTEEPQKFLISESLDHEECTYMLDMYLQ